MCLVVSPMLCLCRIVRGVSSRDPIPYYITRHKYCWALSFRSNTIQPKYLLKSCHLNAFALITMRSPPAAGLMSASVCASATSRTSTQDVLSTEFSNHLKGTDYRMVVAKRRAQSRDVFCFVQPWPQYERRVKDDHIPSKLRLVRLIPVPCRSLRQRLARAVFVEWVCVAALRAYLLDRQIVPVRLVANGGFTA